MQIKLHLTPSPSAVSGAGQKPESASTVALPATVVTVKRIADAEPASARIREVHGLIRDLLLEDDLRANGLLLGSVAVDLNEMLLEFDQICGLQRMFEAVMQDQVSGRSD